ncbi:MAG: acetate kinase [Clostridia bacterium]|nr:acetate kinase [Clostridia bacterium]
MKILVINAGSSSLKYQLIDMETEQVLAKGLCERIGVDGKFSHKSVNGEVSKDVELKNHADAVENVIEALTDKEYGCVASLDEIAAVGHRVLTAGEKIYETVLITDEVKEIVRECIPLGPLHNPANLTGIEACEKAMPGIPQVAVFDTAFHHTMPEKAYLYGLPYEYYEKYGVRRYGFHGTSHRFVTQRTAKLLGKSVDEVNLITCHLGNGSSITAVKNGKCIDTTMGLTPLEGMLMGTRCGAIDPAIVCFIGEKEGLSYAEMDTLMNKKSGLLGVSGVGSDFRDVTKAWREGNHRAGVALEMFAYQCKKYIGSYYAALGGDVDAIVFTAGIGENDGRMRASIVEGLEGLGIKMDAELNAGKCVDKVVSTADSKIKILVVPTNEELMIAKDTAEIVENL